MKKTRVKDFKPGARIWMFATGVILKKKIKFNEGLSRDYGDRWGVTVDNASYRRLIKASSILKIVAKQIFLKKDKGRKIKLLVR